MLNQQTSLDCNGQILDIQHPIIMGILNVTPDSFFDGGRYQKETEVLQQIEKMSTEGATIIDIGGMSSRPGADIISETEELKRVLPVIQKIHETFPHLILSIDTIRAKVAQESIAAGASIINDISAASLDPDLLDTVAKLNVPYILMHMQGQPNTMQVKPAYKNVVVDVLDFFIERVGVLREKGVKDIILDVGFGFGKTVDHNFQLLKNLTAFKILDLPLLVGLSRKSMIYKSLDSNALNALNGTTALHMVALQNGAKILRVHDVKEAAETIALWKILDRQALV